MRVHGIKKRWHVWNRAAIGGNNRILWRRARFGPADSFPQRIVFSHEFNPMHKELLSGLFCGSVVSLEVSVRTVKEVAVFGELAFVGPPRVRVRVNTWRFGVGGPGLVRCNCYIVASEFWVKISVGDERAGDISKKSGFFFTIACNIATAPVRSLFAEG